MPYTFNPLTGQLDYYQIDTVGLTQATADARYLKLDGSNDPLTGDLQMGNHDIWDVTNIETPNGGHIRNGTSSRLDIGFWSTDGAGMEAYRYNDGSRPGQYRLVYGGAVGQGQVLYIQYDGTNFNTRWTMDASGNIVQTGSLTASAFVGDGSGLTNLPASGLTTGQVQALAAGYANLFNY